MADKQHIIEWVTTEAGTTIEAKTAEVVEVWKRLVVVLSVFG